jgi:hypothetical protein
VTQSASPPAWLRFLWARSIRARAAFPSDRVVSTPCEGLPRPRVRYRCRVGHDVHYLFRLKTGDFNKLAEEVDGRFRHAPVSLPDAVASTAKRALVLAQEWGLLARIDRTPYASCQPSTTDPPPQPSTVKPVLVTGVVLLDLVLGRGGETITRFTTAADPTKNPEQLLRLLAHAVRRRGGSVSSLAEYEMDIHPAGQPEPIMTFCLITLRCDASSPGGAERQLSEPRSTSPSDRLLAGGLRPRCSRSPWLDNTGGRSRVAGAPHPRQHATCSYVPGRAMRSRPVER